MADADLKRLKFIYERSTELNKEEDYLKAIQSLTSQAINTEIYADLLYEQALFYKNDQFKLSANNPNDKKPDLVKVVELANKAIQAFPKSNGAKNAENLIKDINGKTLTFQLKEFGQPGRPSQLLFNYKNIDTVQLQVYKVPADFNDYYSVLDNKVKYKEFLETHKTVKSWMVIPPKSVDYQEHTLIAKMDALPYGSYIIIAQNTMDSNHVDRIIQRSNFKVTSMAATHRYINSKNEYFVANSRLVCL